MLPYKKILFPIIMGHSRKGIKQLMIGSIAGHVVKRSTIPVLIVNPDGISDNDAKEGDDKKRNTGA